MAENGETPERKKRGRRKKVPAAVQKKPRVNTPLVPDCDGCVMNYFMAISKFRMDNNASLDFLRNHGVLPRVVRCPYCNAECRLRRDRRKWQCGTTYKISKSKKRRRCEFTVSDNKGTFIQQCHIAPWKVMLFINHWLSKNWDHRTIIECLGISRATSVEWRAICSEVTNHWIMNQESIGGPGVVVELDEALISSERGSLLSQVHMFAGIERISKKKFVIPLLGPNGEVEYQESLVPVIQKYVRVGSVLITRKLSVTGLHKYGYTHHQLKNIDKNHDNPEMHHRTIQRVWAQLKMQVRKPGIRGRYLYQYLARFLFVTAHSDETILIHEFFKQAAKLYPPQSDKRRELASLQLKEEYCFESDEET